MMTGDRIPTETTTNSAPAGGMVETQSSPRAVNQVNGETTDGTRDKRIGGSNILNGLGLTTRTNRGPHLKRLSVGSLKDSLRGWSKETPAGPSDPNPDNRTGDALNLLLRRPENTNGRGTTAVSRPTLTSRNAANIRRTNTLHGRMGHKARGGIGK
jgi:hypothetical protein